MTVKIFEAVMLICFGSAWPFAIYKTWKTKDSTGKSMIFLYVVLAGYASGILCKIYGNMDEIIFLYVLNSMFVFTDILLTLRFRKSQE